MRVTSTHFGETLATQFQRIGERQMRVQTQLATGQRIQTAEDDPLAMQEALQLQADSNATAQYQRNAQVHQEFAAATFNVLRSLQRISDRAQEIATLADGLKNPEDLKAYAVEIGQLIKQAVQVANTKHRDGYLLSGTRIDTPAFSLTTDASGNVTGVNFQGNTDGAESEIEPGTLIRSTVPGANSSGLGERGVLSDAGAGADFFGHLIALHGQLMNGDVAGIAQTTRDQLKTDEENFLYHITNNGALQSRLEAAVSARKDEKLAIGKELSRRADVDIAEASIQLQQTQLNYQAALQSAATILDLSLLDFLR